MVGAARNTQTPAHVSKKEIVKADFARDVQMRSDVGLKLVGNVRKSKRINAALENVKEGSVRIVYALIQNVGLTANAAPIIVLEENVKVHLIA